MQPDFEKDANVRKAINQGVNKAYQFAKETLLTDIPHTPQGLLGHFPKRELGVTSGVRAATEGGTPMFRGKRYDLSTPKPVNRSVGVLKVGFAKHAGHLAALQQYGLLT